MEQDQQPGSPETGSVEPANSDAEDSSAVNSPDTQNPKKTRGVPKSDLGAHILDLVPKLSQRDPN